MIFRRIKKTPTMLQMEATECGSTCLAIILAYWGHELLLEEARSVCGVSRDGSKASHILKAARQFHMTAKGYTVQDINGLDSCPWPCIVHWNFEHFVVFEGRKGQLFYINDPATGRQIVSKEVFSQSFTGVVLTFTPEAIFKKRRLKKALSIFFSYALKGGIFAITAATALSILQLIPGLVMAGTAKVFVDYILIKSLHQWLPPLILTIVLCALFQGGLMIFQGRLLARLKIHFQLNLGASVIHKLFHLPMRFFDQRFAGDILNRFTSVDQLARLLSLDVMRSLTNIISVFLFAGVLYLISPVLLWILLGFFCLKLIVFFLSRKKIRDQTIVLSQEQSKM